MTLTPLGAAKNGGKELVKTATKEGAEFVSENVAKTTAKTATKEVAKTTGETLTENIAKTTAKTAAKETTEALGEKVAKESAKDGTESVAKTAEKKSTKTDKKAVEEIEVESYTDMKKRSVPGDGLDLEHIPSTAAMLEAARLKKKEPLTPKEKRQIINEGTVIAIKKEIHQKGRTYGGKNTKEQIKQDAADLCAAACKDIKVLEQNLKQDGKTQEQIQKAIDKINELNAKKGIK